MSLVGMLAAGMALVATSSNLTRAVLSMLSR
jgi:hypothetical protein